MKDLKVYYMQVVIQKVELVGILYGVVFLQFEIGEKVVVVNSVKVDVDLIVYVEVNVIWQVWKLGFLIVGSILFFICEFCFMCVMVVVWAGVFRVYFGVIIDDVVVYGYQVKIYCWEIVEKAWYDIKVEGGVLQEDCVVFFYK